MGPLLDRSREWQYGLSYMSSIKCVSAIHFFFDVFDHVQDLGADLVKPYAINNERVVNQTLDLKHGKSVKAFNMDRISNAAFMAVCGVTCISETLLTFLQKEFERLVRVCAKEEVKLPTKRELEKKRAQLDRLVAQPVTEVCSPDSSIGVASQFFRRSE